jgi:hypothetical protein
MRIHQNIGLVAGVALSLWAWSTEAQRVPLEIQLSLTGLAQGPDASTTTGCRQTSSTIKLTQNEILQHAGNSRGTSYPVGAKLVAWNGRFFVMNATKTAVLGDQSSRPGLSEAAAEWLGTMVQALTLERLNPPAPSLPEPWPWSAPSATSSIRFMP